MDFKLLVNTINYEECMWSARDTGKEVATSLKNIKTIVNEIPNVWEGTDSQEFVNSFNSYLKELDSIKTFYDNVIGTMDSVLSEYCNKDVDVADKVEVGGDFL